MAEATAETKEKKVKTPEEIKKLEEKRHAEFLAKVGVIVKMSQKKLSYFDTEEAEFIMTSNRVPKLTRTEWESLIKGEFKGFEGTKLPEKFVNEICIAKFKLIKTYTAKASTGERKERTNMVDTIPEGKVFKANLAKFLETQKVNIEAMTKLGIAFQPFYRNLNEKGKHGKTPEVPKS